MANSPLRANISKEDDGKLELNESQSTEMVSNPSALIPVWKLVGFSEMKRECQGLKKGGVIAVKK